jgi:small-conductance mechanosensitive channel
MPTIHGGVGAKLLATIAVIIAVLLAAGLIRALAGAVLRTQDRDRPRFWTTQIVRIVTVIAIVAGVFAIWSADVPELGMAGGWVAAGLAVALQRVVTAFAGYVIVLRGNIYTVGDRITMGGVRGDVVALGFMQTTVMEMGQAPGERSDDPAMWIRGRQYSGRIVRVTNDKIFETPVYNYTREFPFIWDEIVIPIEYGKDYQRAEQFLLDIARRHTADIMTEGRAALENLKSKYFLAEEPSVEPKVFVRLTDNWIELSLRFAARDHGVRGLKDAMYREILAALTEAKLEIASGTYAVVAMPPLKVELTAPVS